MGIGLTTDIAAVVRRRSRAPRDKAARSRDGTASEGAVVRLACAPSGDNPCLRAAFKFAPALRQRA